ncbi:MAG: DrmE family protein [Kosmotogaceae bacterium]
MLEWNDYIKLLLEYECEFDGLTLTLDDEQDESKLPHIIRVSILMLDQMIKAQGKYNVMVFPEKAQTLFFFTIALLIHNIYVGKIEKIYNPYSFIIGEKLKYQNCVVEFNGIETRDCKVCLKFKTSNCDISSPIENLPLFQQTNTNRQLSSHDHFYDTIREAKANLERKNTKNILLNRIADYKTHMDSSIYYVTSIINTKAMINNCKLSGEKISDIFLLGQVDYQGIVRNIGAGQLIGVPAIVLSPDLYSVNTAIENDNPIQSAIIDISNTNTIINQLDAIDNLIQVDVPIVCFTDTANSFYLQPLIERGFTVWRWDKNSITGDLYDVNQLSSDRKIKNYAKKEVIYLTEDSNEICNSLKLIFDHKNEIREQSPKIIKLFDKLYSLLFSALRETVPKSNSEIELAQHILKECDNVLSDEVKYISPLIYRDFIKVINNLQIIYSFEFSFKKHDKLLHHLSMNDYNEVCILVPSNVDKVRVEEYWQSWCKNKLPSTKVSVLNPSEYYTVNCSEFNVTITVGWLGYTIMQKILYSFNTALHVILLYDYECRWKNAHTSFWDRLLKNSNNLAIIKKSFNNDNLDISVSRFIEEEEGTPIPKSEEAEELDNIELILRENKYRQYINKDIPGQIEKKVEAIPVNFVGGYLAFYQIQHEIITATDIIVNDIEKIQMKIPSQLNVGDFIVVREADRDIIRDLADAILNNSDKGEYRVLATKWKEALVIERQSSEPEEIYQKLVAAGCNKSYPAVRRWLFDESIIAPKQKEDIAFIAKITKNKSILEMVDQIVNAAKEVRKAHIQAGRYLSRQLKLKIAETIQKYLDIDPNNIWKPIEIVLEDIGTVRILKVTDVGSKVDVDVTDANRLIEEEGS